MGFLITKKNSDESEIEISGQICMHFGLGIGDVSLMIICHLGQNDLLGMLSSRA